MNWKPLSIGVRVAFSLSTLILNEDRHDVSWVYKILFRWDKLNIYRKPQNSFRYYRFVISIYFHVNFFYTKNLIMYFSSKIDKMLLTKLTFTVNRNFTTIFCITTFGFGKTFSKTTIVFILCTIEKNEKSFVFS